MIRGICALAVVAAILALGGLSGCQKKSMAETKTADPVQKQILHDPTAPPKDLDSSKNLAAGILEPPRLALAALHDDFMKLGPKNGYIYVQASDKLKDKRLPNGEMGISDLIIQYYQIYSKGDVTDPVYRKTTIENYLKTPAFPVPTQEEITDQQLAEQKAAQAAQTGAPWQDALSVFTNPAGDWQSVKEVREGNDKTFVNHDDKYYKKLFIQPSSDPKSLFGGKAILQEFRDGKLEDKKEQPYKFDAQKGELTMYSDEGSPMLVLLMRQMSSEKDILYVKPQFDFVYTVYQRINATAGTNADSSGAPQVPHSAHAGGETGGKPGAPPAKPGGPRGGK